MPLYVYECGACKYTLEVLATSHKEVPPYFECPECKKGSLERKVTSAAVHYKGGGWGGGTKR